MKYTIIAMIFLSFYTLPLRAEINEPAICKIDFEIVRTFHAPIKISIKSLKRDETASLQAEIYSGKGGYGWGEIERTVEKKIDKKTFIKIYKKVLGLRFDRVLNSEHSDGVDGSRWSVKVDRYGTYVSLSAWTPTDDTKKRGLGRFVAFGKLLLDLAEIKIPKKEIY